MAKPPKSQWDFGELFPAEPVRKLLSVSELTGQVKRLLEKQIGQIWVTGEITNFRAQGASGHLYFTLKDMDSQVSCVLFRGEAAESRAFLEDGCKVNLQGTLTVYEPRGQYQLRVTAVELQGVGALQVAFEKLKLKLKAEGLFASERKRDIPRYPTRIGIVTSQTGAAIRDVLHVIQRRQPGLEIILAPCRVQGQGAGEEIAESIRELNEFHDRTKEVGGLDLILVTRGGGSLEDLWAFNEEVVARAIYASEVPVVSAVGHEIDFTISDFVADFRAATPSAAAELITEGAFSSLQFVAGAGMRLRQAMDLALKDRKDELAGVLYRFDLRHPRKRLNESLQRLDDLMEGLTRSLTMEMRALQIRSQNLVDRLKRLGPGRVLLVKRERYEGAVSSLKERVISNLKMRRLNFESVSNRLRLLGPQQVLSRGYSITLDASTGEVIRDPAEQAPGKEIRTVLAKGELRSRVLG